MSLVKVPVLPDCEPTEEPTCVVDSAESLEGLVLGEWDFEAVTIDGICGVY
jgi:hypothetical protein